MSYSSKYKNRHFKKLSPLPTSANGNFPLPHCWSKPSNHLWILLFNNIPKTIPFFILASRWLSQALGLRAPGWRRKSTDAQGQLPDCQSYGLSWQQSNILSVHYLIFLTPSSLGSLSPQPATPSPSWSSAYGPRLSYVFPYLRKEKPFHLSLLHTNQLKTVLIPRIQQLCFHLCFHVPDVPSSWSSFPDGGYSLLCH